MAQYYVVAEELETLDKTKHARGETITLSDDEAQIAIGLKAVVPIDPVQQYRFELAQLQAREQELQALIAAGTAPATTPAAQATTPVATTTPAVAPTAPATSTSSVTSSAAPATSPASTSESGTSSSDSTTSAGSGK